MDIQTMIDERLSLGRNYMNGMAVNEAFSSSRLLSHLVRDEHNAEAIRTCKGVLWDRIKDSQVGVVSTPAEMRKIFNGEKANIGKNPIYIFTDANDGIIFIMDKSNIAETVKSDNPMAVTKNLPYAWPKIFDDGTFSRRVDLRNFVKETFADAGIDFSNMFTGSNKLTTSIRGRICKFAYLLIQYIANNVPDYNHAVKEKSGKEKLQPFFKFPEGAWIELINNRIITDKSFGSAFRVICGRIGYDPSASTSPSKCFYFESAANSDGGTAKTGFNNFMSTCVRGGGDFPISNVKGVYEIISPRILAAIIVGSYIGEDSVKQPGYDEAFAIKVKNNYDSPDMYQEMLEFVEGDGGMIDTTWSMLTNISGKNKADDNFTQVGFSLLPDYVSKCYIVGIKPKDADAAKSGSTISAKFDAIERPVFPVGTRNKVEKIMASAFPKGNRKDAESFTINTDVDTMIDHFRKNLNTITPVEDKCIVNVMNHLGKKTDIYELKRNGRPFITDEERKALMNFCDTEGERFRYDISSEEMQSITNAIDSIQNHVRDLQSEEETKKSNGRSTKQIDAYMSNANARCSVLAKLMNRYVSAIDDIYSEGSPIEILKDTIETYKTYRDVRSNPNAVKYKRCITIMEGLRKYFNRVSLSVIDKSTCTFMMSAFAHLKEFNVESSVFKTARAKMAKYTGEGVKLETTKVKVAFVKVLRAVKEYDDSEYGNSGEFDRQRDLGMYTSLVKSRRDDNREYSQENKERYKRQYDDMFNMIADESKRWANALNSDDDKVTFNNLCTYFGDHFKGYTPQFIRNGQHVSKPIDVYGTFDFDESKDACDTYEAGQTSNTSSLSFEKGDMIVCKTGEYKSVLYVFDGEYFFNVLPDDIITAMSKNNEGSSKNARLNANKIMVALDFLKSSNTKQIADAVIGYVNDMRDLTERMQEAARLFKGKYPTDAELTKMFSNPGNRSYVQRLGDLRMGCDNPLFFSGYEGYGLFHVLNDVINNSENVYLKYDTVLSTAQDVIDIKLPTDKKKDGAQVTSLIAIYDLVEAMRKAETGGNKIKGYGESMIKALNILSQMSITEIKTSNPNAYDRADWLTKTDPSTGVTTFGQKPLMRYYEETHFDDVKMYMRNLTYTQRYDVKRSEVKFGEEDIPFNRINADIELIQPVDVYNAVKRDIKHGSEYIYSLLEGDRKSDEYEYVRKSEYAAYDRLISKNAKICLNNIISSFEYIDGLYHDYNVALSEKDDKYAEFLQKQRQLNASYDEYNKLTLDKRGVPADRQSDIDSMIRRKQSEYVSMQRALEPYKEYFDDLKMRLMKLKKLIKKSCNVYLNVVKSLEEKRRILLELDNIASADSAKNKLSAIADRLERYADMPVLNDSETDNAE